VLPDGAAVAVEAAMLANTKTAATHTDRVCLNIM
jgi:hypothetical protein